MIDWMSFLLGFFSGQLLILIIALFILRAEIRHRGLTEDSNPPHEKLYDQFYQSNQTQELKNVK